MGFLSAISKGLDYLSAPLSNPVTFFTKGPTAAAKKVATTRKEIAAGRGSPLKVVGTVLASTAVAAGAVIAAAPAAALSGSSAAARALTYAKPIISKAIAVPAVKKTGAIALTAAVVAPKTFNILATNKAVQKTVVATAVNPVLGVATGIEQGTNLVKEAVKGNTTELKQVGAIAGGALVAGAGIVAVDKSIDYFKNLKESEKGGVIGTEDLPKDVKTPATEELKTTPVVEKVPTTGTTGQRISQKVIVNVNQRQTKRYINAGVYVGKNGRIR